MAPSRTRFSRSSTFRTGGSSRGGESAEAAVLRFLIRRFAAALLLLLLVLTVTFFLAHLAPGDPLGQVEDSHMTAAQKAHLKALCGLDQPLPVQYLAWLQAIALHGDWGTS